MMEQLERLGHRVPQEVAIAAVDGVHPPGSADLPIITASQPTREIGEQAADLLVARIRDPQARPEQRFLQPRLPCEAPQGATIS